jgi:PAS domain S-box-containing protein
MTVDSDSMNTELPVRTTPPSALGTELEARFFDLSLDMLCILDFDGHFKRLNRAWETTLGFTREELMSKRFIEFVHLEDRERTLQQNGKVRTGGQARFFENRYMCKDGSYRWLLWNSTPDPARQVIYGVARDITAGKQAECERETLVQNL